MNSPSPSRPIAVLGAGITGLTTAHRLAADGRPVRVFEASGHVGGAIGSELADGWLIEKGPNTLLEGDPAFTSLVREIGLDRERVPANAAAKKRFIVRDGQLMAAPMSPPALIQTKLFSGRAKRRLLTEVMFRRRTRPADVSLASFVRDHFGDELVDYGLNPFVSGVYAGDPDQLSARHAFPQLWEIEQKHGSIIRGQIAQAKERRARGAARSTIVSFTGGLRMLPDTLAARLPADSLRLGARIVRVIPGSPWRVVWNDNAGDHEEEFERVISALPAPGLAGLTFGSGSERPLAGLESIAHPPVSSLFLGYRRDRVKHPLDGFGALVPAVEKKSVLGILFSSTLFPNRAPEDHVALTVMAGGARQPEVARLGLDALLARVRPDLEDLVGAQGDPVFLRHTFWPRAIPQYNLGYEKYLGAMETCERTYPGFLIGGQVRDGIAVPACVAAGEKLALRAMGA